MPVRARLYRPILWSALSAVLVVTTLAGAQSGQKPASKKAAHRVNELTLAGLRPGTDTTKRAEHLYKMPDNWMNEQGELNWKNGCYASTLTVSYNQKQKIETIRVSKMQGSLDADCFGKDTISPWRTGHGLAIKDSATKMRELYGEPDSRSPSTKDGQPLELWYYAFDWAGADVPQVMEVLCTKEQDGRPGRVVEITLAAPSL